VVRGGKDVTARFWYLQPRGAVPFPDRQCGPTTLTLRLGPVSVAPHRPGRLRGHSDKEIDVSLLPGFI
jgi:hypothetical protein